MAEVNRLHSLLLTDQEYYEALSRYAPTAEFLGIVRAVLPPTWRLSRRDVWYSARPAGAPALPAQGWKIHVSARLADAPDVLRAAAEVFRDRGMPFKFALDPGLLRQLNGKNWSRAGSGKFITAYPADEEQFRAVMADLYVALRGFRGPYVLSDRRYRDAEVLYYRYGGLTLTSTMAPTGEKQAVLVAPDGGTVPDLREPFFSLPEWVADPWPAPPSESAGEPMTLRNGRYVIDQPLHYSNTGGVYLATDTTTGAQVVIKEARPHSGGAGSGGSFELLTKEYAVLERLAPSGLAPQPVELFREWEHLFLAEEYLPGRSLHDHGNEANALLHPRVDETAATAFREHLAALWTALATALARVHALGVVLGDLSPHNVIVASEEPYDLRFIDFEATIRLGVDRPTRLSTPGYASASHASRGAAGVADDYYALGSLMLASLFPLNPMFGLDAAAPTRVLDAAARDLALPASWRHVIEALLDPDPERRPGPAEVVAALTGPDTASEPVVPDVAGPAALAGRIATHIWDTADFTRGDRLFPGDARLFSTNPLSVAHGAAGVGYALAKITGEVPDEVVAWILAHDVTAQEYTAGLYTGASGIAWALAELGALDAARRVMAVADTHPARFASADVYSGAAGYGLASLYFWQRTSDDAHLAAAIEAAEHLLAVRHPDGSWPNANGQTDVGYAYGASGIALFLLYLHLATGDPGYLDAGRSALDFDLAQGMSTDGLLSFPRYAGHTVPLYPYWEHGSAGVGTALVRYCAVTGDEVYRKTLDQLAVDTGRRWALYPGLFHGLAGLGNFLLDCHHLLGDEAFLDEARRVADGVAVFAMERPQGVAFPGDMLLRVSTDLATGSAGIGLFLKRLAEPGPDLTFTLDSLLP